LVYNHYHSSQSCAVVLNVGIMRSCNIFSSP